VLHRRFAERGHPEIRPPHDNVMQFLDDAGTRVSVLAHRAQITKQSMAELVAHLERLGYVERVPDPTDRRAKLVRATERGEQLYAIAREVIAEIEAEWTRQLGKAKMRQLRELLEELNAAL
jgi:DNA-binding MarR family transcriptional regulator